ncbi:hypothetical protein A2442_01685 [Candidatus Campbellbacteria bacterium RIFOXYC2_FULL_35_25]|uniref:YgiT-type zinc finger domain-containing protein n=1 Tax=Candidatus Campbellbacteria bacterium RIFOXYC2_FULL_35_25 TaxID=1797582 RepID=A0A1F5EHX9_9BACT|nr:MAG: hypothetical protein A2442_01685 [Candidatus Campbellbacteria bacterium RIFOXYC2_FULL_35_25]
MKNRNTAHEEGMVGTTMFLQIVPEKCEACGQKKSGLEPKNVTVLAYDGYPQVEQPIFICPECDKHDWSLLHKPKFVTSQ